MGRQIICAKTQRSSIAPRQNPSRNLPAGGKGLLSAEFLSVSGALATIISIPVIGYLTAGVPVLTALSRKSVKTACLTISSFAYGLFLSRFDLEKARTLKLTIAFSLLLRFVAIPVLSHTVAIAGYTLVKLSASGKTAAAAAAAAVVQNAPATAKATANSLSLPAGVLSSLFLLSTTPMVYSPSIALLSQHVHTTLLAILMSLTIFLFPVLPAVSHVVSVWAHHSAFLNIGATLPKVAPPPPFITLFLTTTLPFTTAVTLSRSLPSRLSAIAGLVSLPIAWMASLTLMAGAASHTAHVGITGLAGSIGLCGGVSLMMLLLARLLSSALLLRGRAKRTLILYLCMQGTVVGAGLAPVSFSPAPHVASAIIGLMCIVVMARAWSHVVIRTSKDVI